MKGDYQKPFKKLTLFFISNPVPFNGQSYKKQKGLGTSDQSFFRLWNKFKKKICISYFLSDQVWQCNIKQFLSYSKITPANLCKPIHDIINYSTYICSFESGKCGKEEEKLQKFEYLENGEIFFAVFEGLSFGEKIKIW